MLFHKFQKGPHVFLNALLLLLLYLILSVFVYLEKRYRRSELLLLLL